MAKFIALLRAVNVGGTCKLAMTDFTAACERAGGGRVRTYIASGNAVFDHDGDEAAVKAALEAELAASGAATSVIVRSAAEIASVLAANPFADAPPNRVMTIFLAATPAANSLDRLPGHTDEVLALGVREIYVYYPRGQADTKLRIPAAATGTARNMNTVARLAAMAAET